MPTFQVTFTTLALASVSSSSTADVEGTRTDLKVVKTVKSLVKVGLYMTVATTKHILLGVCTCTQVWLCIVKG